MNEEETKAAAIIGELDQTAAAVQLTALLHARYYNVLIGAGVPLEQAIILTDKVQRLFWMHVLNEQEWK